MDHPPAPALDLRDMHLPEPPSWWPPAPGWWILLALVVGVALLGGFFWQHRRKNRLRRAALAELEGLVAAYATHGDPSRLTGALSALLRRVCLTAEKPGQPSSVAGLTGTAWLNFLDQTLPDQPFTHGAGQWLIATPFQRGDTAPSSLSEENLAALIALCRTWLQHYPIPGRSLRSAP